MGYLFSAGSTTEVPQLMVYLYEGSAPPASFWSAFPEVETKRVCPLYYGMNFVEVLQAELHSIDLKEGFFTLINTSNADMKPSLADEGAFRRAVPGLFPISVFDCDGPVLADLLEDLNEQDQRFTKRSQQTPGPSPFTRPGF